jgi:uncharacterized membrane protein
MSQRIYTGPRREGGANPSGWVPYIPWMFAVLTIALQISWVLVSGSTRTAFTILTVTTFFLASATHAYVSRGLTWTASFLGITLAFGWLIEAIGTATQFPFGDYSYSDDLGLAILGVPIVIPMAWSMMSYPILLAVQRLSSTALGVAVLGSWLLFSWDLFLDPQMVGEGYWVWTNVDWTLPGIDNIPLQNFLGWLLSGFVLMWLLDRLPRKSAKDGVPILMLSWMFVSNVLANAVFFDRPAVALWGGIAMAIVVLPWWWRLWTQPQW